MCTLPHAHFVDGGESAFLVHFEAMTALWWSLVNTATRRELNRTHWRRALQEKSKGNWQMNLQPSRSHGFDGFFPSGFACFTFVSFLLGKN